MVLGHVGDNILNQSCMRVTKGSHWQVSRRYPLKAMLVVMRNIPAFTRKKPVRRSAVADQIHDQHRPEIGRNPLGTEQFMHIKEVAWVLPIEGGDTFSSVEIGK